MKRQPKPFAIEIKRSRRSPLSSSTPKAGFLEGGGADFDEGAPLERAARLSADAELAIPAFLQPDKASRRPSSKTTPQDLFNKEIFKNKGQVFAAARQPSASDAPASDAASSEAPAPPRILPSLIPSADVEDSEIQPKRAKKIRGDVAAPRAAAKKATRGARKEFARAAPSVAADGDAPARPERGAAQGQRPATRPNSIAKRQGLAGENRAKGKMDKPPVVAPAFAAEASRDDKSSAPALLNLTKRSRHDAADLPLGQRWKRRLHPRAR
jgi:hypothetical protein